MSLRSAQKKLKCVDNTKHCLLPLVWLFWTAHFTEAAFTCSSVSGPEHPRSIVRGSGRSRGEGGGGVLKYANGKSLNPWVGCAAPWKIVATIFTLWHKFSIKVFKRWLSRVWEVIVLYPVLSSIPRGCSLCVFNIYAINISSISQYTANNTSVKFYYLNNN